MSSGRASRSPDPSRPRAKRGTGAGLMSSGRASRSPRCDVLLVAGSRQSRALLLAELQERAFDVIAEPGLRFAARAVIVGRLMPRCIVIDVQEDEDATPDRVAELLDTLPGVPAIVVTGTYGREVWEPLRPRLAGLLHRPVTVGQIVAAVDRALQGRAATHGPWPNVPKGSGS